MPSLLLLFVELPWGLFCSILSPWPLIVSYPSVISRLGFFFWRLSRLVFEVLRSWLWILPSFGGLSFPCPCCFSLAITPLCFVQVTWVFWTFCLGFLSLDLQCFTGSSEWLRLMFQFCPVSSLAVCLSGLFFCEQHFLASVFETPRSCLALALRFFLDGFMVRTHCPSISRFRLGFSFPSFGSGGASFGDIL